MAMRGSSHYVSCAGYVDFSGVRMTSPTCEELGIPTEMGVGVGVGAGEAGAMYTPFFTPRVIRNPSLHLEGLRYEAEARQISDPYSPLCMIPLPGSLALHASSEPSFIRKRNERERERVRCVNDGYERLKEHLPQASKDKRISKVETLRGAIDYIKHLQQILDEAPSLSPDSRTSPEHGDDSQSPAQPTKLRFKASAEGKLRAPEMQLAPGDGDRRYRKRAGSLSSDLSAQSDGTLSDSEDEHSLKRRRLQ